MKDYLSVKSQAESEIVIERSRFIGYAKPVASSDEAKEFISKIKKLNSLATHNTYAYISDKFGIEAKASDDGEPQGTAGLPILEVLKNKKLYNTCVVVTRYFGGIKLGAGGLVRAYTKSATDVLDKAGVSYNTFSSTLDITMSYDKYSKFNLFVEHKTVVIKNSDFNVDIKVTIAMPLADEKSFKTELFDLMQGKVLIENVGTGYENY